MGKHLFIIAAFVLTVALQSPVQSLQVTVFPPDCTSIRFIFIVNRAYEMGNDYDPENARYQAVTQIMTYVTSLYFDFFQKLEADACYDLNLAVVNFSNTADAVQFNTSQAKNNPWLNLTLYQGMSESALRQQVEADLDRAQSDVVPEGCQLDINNDEQPCNAGGADFAQAYRTALGLLSARYGVDSGTNQHVAIVFISNGTLCMQDPCSPSDYAGDIANAGIDMQDALNQAQASYPNIHTYFAGLDRQHNPTWQATGAIWKNSGVFDRVIPDVGAQESLDDVEQELFPTLVGIVNDFFDRPGVLPEDIRSYPVDNSSLLDPNTLQPIRLETVSALTLRLVVAAGFAPSPDTDRILAITSADGVEHSGHNTDATTQLTRPIVGLDLDAYAAVGDFNLADPQEQLQAGPWSIKMRGEDHNLLGNNRVLIYQRDAAWLPTSTALPNVLRSVYQYTHITLGMSFEPVKTFGPDVGICVTATPSTTDLSQAVLLTLQPNGQYEGAFHPLSEGNLTLLYRLCDVNTREQVDPATYQAALEVWPIEVNPIGDCASGVTEKRPGEQLNFDLELISSSPFVDGSLPVFSGESSGIVWYTQDVNHQAWNESTTPEAIQPSRVDTTGLIYRHQSGVFSNTSGPYELSLALSIEHDDTYNDAIATFPCVVSINRLDIEAEQVQDNGTVRLTISESDDIAWLVSLERPVEVRYAFNDGASDVRTFDCNIDFCYVDLEPPPSVILPVGHYQLHYSISWDQEPIYPMRDHEDEGTVPVNVSGVVADGSA